MHLPAPRGPLGETLLRALRREPGPVAEAQGVARAAIAATTDVLADDDLQLSLLLLYELHYRGLDGVDDAWEWQPDLLRLRADIESAFESALRAAVPVPPTSARTADEVARALFDLTAADDGPSVSRYLAKQATDAQARELVVQRSIYHLKEADPHSWALPAADRSAQVRAGRDPVRRVRRRPTRPHPRRALRRARCARSAWTTPTARTSTRSRR